MTPVPRVFQRELIDDPVQDLAEMTHSLGQVAQVNRWLGGSRALRRHLRPATRKDSWSLLDVGAGNGATLRELATWARRSGTPPHAVALDLSPLVAGIAVSEGSPAVVCGDALSLPFADDCFDVVMCTLTLHHFAEAEAIDLVREMARVSRGTVLVNDLERTRANYLGARLLAVTVWRGNRLTRHDGPLSVLRSFTAEELKRIGESAGLRSPRVHRHFPWRLVLEGAA